MNHSVPEALLSRLLKVQRRRRADAFLATTFNVIVGQLLLASFVLGYARGPGSMAVYEVVGGVLVVLVLSLVFNRLLARRRRERHASWVVRLVERNKPCRVARFDGYVTIGDEIVLDETVQKAEREDGRLILRYLDPRFSGPVLREFEGSGSDLERVREAVAASIEAGADMV